MIAAIAGIALGLVVYVYAGYPLVLWAATRGRDSAPEPPPGPDDELPVVSVVVPARNEERAIEAKLRNLLALDYPADRREIVVVSDASTDRTDEIVRSFAREGVRLERLETREGKAAALNRGLATTSGEIVVFTDASIVLSPTALRAVVGPFRDPRVGCVSGEDHIPGDGGEGLYGRFELALRRMESRFESIVGASGCFYAQRRSLCEPFPAGMAPDFFSVLATARAGFRSVTEPSATGEMRSVAAAGREFDRKVRTVLRGITTLWAFRGSLAPWPNPRFAFELWSHKVLRWAVGPLLVVALAGSAAAADRPLWLALFVAQVAFYLMAGFGWLLRERRTSPALVRIPFFFCLVNLAALAATVQFAAGRRQELWEPSRR